LDRLHTTARGETRTIANCAPGEQFLFIDENGMASPCSFTSDTLGIPLAELNTAEKIAGLPARFSARRNNDRPAVCADCPSTHVFEKFSPAMTAVSSP
jgi:hypothetical protein